MGIRGLKSFFDNNSDLTKSYQLHDTYLVIDGNNIKYALYGRSSTKRNDHMYGGDYVHYGKVVKQFFTNLLKCNVVPIVVFDGAYDRNEMKWQTVMKRVQSRLSNCRTISKAGQPIDKCFPILATEVFKSIMFNEFKGKIYCVQTLFEADNEIAVLANHYNCPVLSNDSDFYVFDLKCGYVIFDSLDYEHVQRAKTEENDSAYFFLQATFYTLDELLVYFPGLNRSMLPLFSTLMGNDYVSCTEFENIFSVLPQKNLKSRSCNKAKGLHAGKRHVNMVRLLNWLCDKELEETQKFILKFLKTQNRNKALDLMSFNIANYKNRDDAIYLLRFLPRRDCELDHTYSTKSFLEDNNLSNIPHWFIELFTQSKLDSSFLNVVVNKRNVLLPQIDDTKLESSYKCSENLEEKLYSLLRLDDATNETILVYDRNGGNIVKRTVNIANDVSVPSLNSIPCLSEEERRGFIYSVFETTAEEFADASKLICQHFSALPDTVVDDLSVILNVINFWLKKIDRVWFEFIIALLTTVVRGIFKVLPRDEITTAEVNAGEISLEKFDKLPHHNNAKSFNSTTTHFYSQLQAILLFKSGLNSILLCPLSRIKLHNYFNGILLYNLSNDLYTRPDPVLYINQLLGRQSKLSIFFNSLLSFILCDKNGQCKANVIKCSRKGAIKMY